MKPTRILFDMASVMWTALRAGVDKDSLVVEHNGKQVTVNSAAYGYENAVNHMVATLKRWSLTPKDCVLVFEGMDSKKRRCMIDPTYKSKRDGDKPPESYIEYNKLKAQLRQVWGDLGAISASQDYVEGDDVLAYIAENSEEDVLVSTNDNDLIVLNKVNAYGAKVMVAINGEVGLNKYGDFDFALVTLYKSLVGDSSDGVKGCPGFGPAAFLNLIAKYGEDGAYELMYLIRDGKLNELAVLAKDNQCKILQKIVDNWAEVVKSYKLVLLHPEWVNTIRQQLEWAPGMVKAGCEDERLRQWQAVNRLVTAENFDSRMTFLLSKLPESASIGFDIETSTPEESDDWLEAQGNPDGVDVFGSYLVGFSLTFGVNNQYTFYVSVKHRDTPNITMKQARSMIEACFGKPMLIQNTSFELSVLHNAEDEDGTLWKNAWEIYGQHGFIPNVRDTVFEGSYVDENVKLGLKFRSQYHLGYEQATFQETTRKTGPVGSLPVGGRRIKSWSDEGVVQMETRQYKMHELTAREVFKYGADDTICTSALGNFYKLIMQLEHAWQVYLQVELDAAYQHAKNFVDGVTFNLAKMKELEALDKETYEQAWGKVRGYLIENGWEGTVPPVYTKDITAKEIKEAYSIVFDLMEDDEDEEVEADEDASDYHQPAAAEVVKDPILSSRVRTPAKFVALLEAEGHDDFAAMLKACLAGDAEGFTRYVQTHFKGEPRFKMSNKMMCKLLYQTMGLPIKVRNKPTAAMKAQGLKEGNPKGDALALAYALRDGTSEQVEVLEALKLMQMVKTRMSLFYSKYPYLLHWKDGKIHSSHNQCATNTRRASSSGPNLQQLPKHQKIEGYPSRFRETFVPHKPNAVIVSMDFASQELRVIADYSKDPNMLACFVGDNLKDMHCLTAAGIMAKEQAGTLRSAMDLLTVRPEDTTEAQYQAFVLLSSGTPEQQKLYKLYRALGKKVNFTSEYGAAAPKLASTMLIDEDTAQSYLDAREAAFPVAAAWKRQAVDEAKTFGFVRSKLGAVRHLAKLLNSDDRYTASKAERQSVNYKIQGSSAEMTKLAEGRMWQEGLFFRFDAVCYGPIHDEVVASVAVEDLYEFLPAMHACMVGDYADMTVPIESSISLGRNFSAQFELGNLATPQAIKLALESLDTI